MRRQLFYTLLLALLSMLAINTQAQQCNGNYLSTSGNKLFDSNGNEVQLTGVNWFGFETAMLYPHGIWSRDCKSMLQQIKDQGFNCIRIPWCNEILDEGATININSYGVDPYTGVSPMNAVESTKTKPIEIMDIIVEWCQENNMKIILDNHSRQTDGYMNELLWYTDETPESEWISDWVFMAERYKNYDAVVAMDLNNEPHGKYGNGARWGDSSPDRDWNKAAERCGNAILNVNPNVLIMVEGIEEYQDETYWWGGNLQGVRDYPVQLSNQSKLVYSPHEYGPTVHNQDWFSAPDFPQNMPGIWEENFNFIHTEEISPLFVGEFGIRDPDGTDEIWFDTFMAYMGEKGYSWTFWCWNPNSGDTGGLLNDQWNEVVEWKMDKLRPYLAPEIPNCGGTVDPNIPPVASVSADPLSGAPGVNVTFDASGSSDADGAIISYSWNFDDGTTGSGETTLHNFADAGSYDVVLTVTDDEGATDQASVTITVGESDIPVTGITTDISSTTVNLEMTRQITATVLPDNATNKAVTWTSDDEAVATVNNSGLITGHMVGDAIITVTTEDGGFSADVFVEVFSELQPVTGVELSSQSVELTEGETIQLNADVLPSDASNQNVEWSVENSSVASVNQSGLVTAISEGIAYVTVTTEEGGYTATCDVVVVPEGTGGCENPVSISIPFAQDGAGEYCFVTNTEIAFVNSWNTDLVEINGVDYTNTWSNNLPPANSEGEWVIHYVGSFAWSHFEAPAAKGAASESLSAVVTVFPNPFNDQVTIDLSNVDEVNRIEILNTLGQVIFEENVEDQPSNSWSINIDESGSLFVIRISTNNQIITKTIVKQ